jgi:hypothetical protein
MDVTATRIRFKPKDCIKPPVIKNFTAVKLMAKKILVIDNAICAFVLSVNAACFIAMQKYFS